MLLYHSKFRMGYFGYSNIFRLFSKNVQNSLVRLSSITTPTTACRVSRDIMRFWVDKLERMKRLSQLKPDLDFVEEIWTTHMQVVTLLGSLL